MADSKISDLPSEASPTRDDLVPLVDSGTLVTKKTTVGDLGESVSDLFQSPDFSYDGNGNLTLITYGDGSTKTFSYTSNKLTQIDFQILGKSYIKRKTLIYSGDTLIRIDPSIV